MLKVEIRSDYPRDVFWRFFEAADDWYWVGLIDGKLPTGGTKVLTVPEIPQRYQLEFKKGDLTGPFLMTPWREYHHRDGRIYRTIHPYTLDDGPFIGFHILEDGNVNRIYTHPDFGEIEMPVQDQIHFIAWVNEASPRPPA